MKTIRRNTFETNSSSSHTVTVTSNNKVNDWSFLEKYIDFTGTLLVPLGDYENRETAFVTDPYSKLCFLATYICESYDHENHIIFESFKNLLLNANSRIRTIIFKDQCYGFGTNSLNGDFISPYLQCAEKMEEFVLNENVVLGVGDWGEGPTSDEMTWGANIKH